jgi:hypothetical protein
LLFGSVGRSWPRRLTYLTSYLVGAALIYGTLALHRHSVWPSWPRSPQAPLSAPSTRSLRPSLWRTPQPQLLGRVVGALTTVAQSAIPVGALLAGVVVQGAGLLPTIVGMGVIYVVVVIGMFFNPALRGMDLRHETSSERTDSPATPQNGKTEFASRRTDIR